MRILCLAIVLFICTLSATAQLSWNWAKSQNLSLVGFTLPASIATDALGNVYVCGKYSLLANASFYHIFLSKYDAAGNLIWTKTAGSKRHDMANSITTDPPGNIYITGSYGETYSTPAADSAFFENLYLVSHANGDKKTFVTKYDPQGNAIRGKRAKRTL